MIVCGIMLITAPLYQTLIKVIMIAMEWVMPVIIVITLQTLTRSIPIMMEWVMPVIMT